MIEATLPHCGHGALFNAHFTIEIKSSFFILIQLKLRLDGVKHFQKLFRQALAGSATAWGVREREKIWDPQSLADQPQRHILKMRRTIQHDHFWNAKNCTLVEDSLTRRLRRSFDTNIQATIARMIILKHQHILLGGLRRVSLITVKL